jgi:hypothetical protein
MKTVYICGDSFSTPDPAYGPMWVELLQTRLGADYKIINKSTVSASNLLVAVQVDHAIKNLADYIIVLATTCTRNQVLVQAPTRQDLMTRFDQQELISYSVFRTYRSALGDADRQQVHNFHRRFDDFELNIFRDYMILLGILHRLTQSGIPFRFDQGGFEHPRFGGQGGYFAEFNQVLSRYNAWDYSTTVDERPYYHITDATIHELLADYYYTEITQRI